MHLPQKRGGCAGYDPVHFYPLREMYDACHEVSVLWRIAKGYREYLLEFDSILKLPAEWNACSSCSSCRICSLAAAASLSARSLSPLAEDSAATSTAFLLRSNSSSLLVPEVAKTYQIEFTKVACALTTFHRWTRLHSLGRGILSMRQVHFRADDAALADGTPLRGVLDQRVFLELPTVSRMCRIALRSAIAAACSQAGLQRMQLSYGRRCLLLCSLLVFLCLLSTLLCCLSAGTHVKACTICFSG